MSVGLSVVRSVGPIDDLQGLNQTESVCMTSRRPICILKRQVKVQGHDDFQYKSLSDKRLDIQSF